MDVPVSFITAEERPRTETHTFISVAETHLFVKSIFLFKSNPVAGEERGGSNLVCFPAALLPSECFYKWDEEKQPRFIFPTDFQEKWIWIDAVSKKPDCCRAGEKSLDDLRTWTQQMVKLPSASRPPGAPYVNVCILSLLIIWLCVYTTYVHHESTHLYLSLWFAYQETQTDKCKLTKTMDMQVKEEESSTLSCTCTVKYLCKYLTVGKLPLLSQTEKSLRKRYIYLFSLRTFTLNCCMNGSAADLFLSAPALCTRWLPLH